MKRVLRVMMYPFAMVLGALSWASFGGDSGNGVGFLSDVVRDRGYDGQELFNRIEHRNT
ncbi:hypothetical protein [Paenibacillus tundrae]|uniref:Uncharacterized protein n=1 Tax=Paenibacillus tundrae TaxID=528187 RepID=A0ABT9W835_9BACL|nr:hypothetical protein [Paenibacillus tundrae]MDQ0169408.1 hypothetical protein [Paenibacillus tundrae]